MEPTIKIPNPQVDPTENRELSPALKGKYRLNGIKPGKIAFKNQTFDLRDIPVEIAEWLVKNKCSYIERIPQEDKAVQPKASNLTDKRTNSVDQGNRNRK